MVDCSVASQSACDVTVVYWQEKRNPCSLGCWNTDSTRSMQHQWTPNKIIDFVLRSGKNSPREQVSNGHGSLGRRCCGLCWIASPSVGTDVPIVGVGSVRLSFIVASSFSESRKRMAGEELSLFTANLNVKVLPERFVHSVRLTNKLIVVSIICVL